MYVRAAGCNFIKNKLRHRCFLVNFKRFFKATFFERPWITAAVGTVSDQ